MNNNDLPKTVLETYFLVPLKLEATGNQELDTKHFLNQIENSPIWNQESAKNHNADFITGGDQSELSSESINRIHYQAFNYFHPFVQRFWYGKSPLEEDKFVRRYRHKKLRSIAICLPYTGKEVRLDAVCDLLYFKPNIVMLSLHVRSREELDYGDTLNLLDSLRRTYPPYFYINKGAQRAGKLPNKVTSYDRAENILSQYINNAETATDYINETRKEAEKGYPEGHHWSAHWKYLLPPLIETKGKKPKFRVKQLGDDRAATASLVSVVSSSKTSDFPHLIDEGNITRLCFVDGAGSDISPYSQRFLKQKAADKALSPFEDRYCYDRYWYKDNESSDSPSRIMNCGYAFTWLGSINDQYYFNDEVAGAPVIFRHMYVPMAVIAHFQQAKLLSLMSELSDAVLKDTKDDKRLQRCQRDFIEFTQTYWFSEISPQEQGIELFEMWRKELRLEHLYNDVRSQLQDVMAHLQTEQTNSLNNSIVFLTWTSIIIAVLGLTTGLLGINTYSVESDNSNYIQILYQNCINLIVRYSIFVSPVIVGLCVAYVLVRKISSKIVSPIKKLFKKLIN